MAGQLLQLKAFPYDGSQDSTRHPLLIDAKDIVESDNIVYSTYSTKQKRPGLLQAFPQRPPGNRQYLSGTDFHRLGSQWVVVYDGVQIKAINPTTGLEDIISSGVDIPVNVPVHFTVFSGLLIIFFDDGGNTSPKKWTGTGVISDLGATAPNSPFGMVFLNCLWVSDPTVEGRINKSQTGDPTAFTGGDSASYDLDVNDGDPDGITAIMPPLYGNLYVSKRLSVYKITPRFNGATLFFSQEKIIDGLGAFSHGAVIQAEGTNFFASDRGVHYLESTDKVAGIETKFVSLPIQNDWRNDINFNRVKFSKMVYDIGTNSLLFLYPRVGRNFNSDLWGFSLAVGKWYQWQSFDQTCLFRYIEKGTKKVRTLCGSSSGDLGYLDSSTRTDYGRSITNYLRTGIIAPSGGPNDNFKLTAITPVFVPQQSGTFDITYKCNGRIIETLTFDMTASFDGGLLGVDFILGETALGSLPQVAVDTRTTWAEGMFFEFIITHTPSDNEANTGFELLGFLLDLTATTKVHGRTVG